MESRMKRVKNIVRSRCTRKESKTWSEPVKNLFVRVQRWEKVRRAFQLDAKTLNVLGKRKSLENSKTKLDPINPMTEIWRTVDIFKRDSRGLRKKWKTTNWDDFTSNQLLVAPPNLAPARGVVLAPKADRSESLKRAMSKCNNGWTRLVLLAGTSFLGGYSTGNYKIYQRFHCLRYHSRPYNCHHWAIFRGHSHGQHRGFPSDFNSNSHFRNVGQEIFFTSLLLEIFE